ncbi:unnamed protein product [Didymodactylos carnosus]|uniref:Uncharacterized protein n=1 Tax=Didymodactylos carnosus TaxID=1234261 RepID=A0A8S2KHE7_9BILA|nr:unnamed protein product [Didymodactylos carnosus]CAF3849684.1 unnamed protein product [Didymodactylos carnosus]
MSAPSRYQLNSTLNDIVSLLMVEEWNANASFSSYYKQCTPQECTYTYFGHNNVVYIVSTITGLIGGLTKVLQIIIPPIVEFVRKKKRPKEEVAEMSSPKSTKSSHTTKAKIGRHDLEQYYDDFKEYNVGDLKVPQAVITRWNSQFNTVSQILDIPSVLLSDILTDQKKGELILSIKDLHVLREFISAFTLFAEATTKTQAERCVSISLVAPSILSIYFDLENELKVCEYSSSLCKMLIYSLKQRFGGLLLSLEIPVNGSIKRRNTFSLFSDDIFLISSFLDGQFRLRWILQSLLPEEAKNRLGEKIKRLVVQAAVQVCHSTNNNQSVDDAQGNKFSNVSQKAQQYVKTFNIIKSHPPPIDPHDMGNQLISTRLFVVCLLAALFILTVYTALIDVTITHTVASPSLEQYEKLYENYPLTLSCPCKTISCAPQACTYTYSGHNNVVYIVTTITGLIGGLTKVLQIIIPPIVEFVRKKKRPKEEVAEPFLAQCRTHHEVMRGVFYLKTSF